MYRIKLSIWFRQLYLPGVRGAAAILLINLVVVVTIRIATRRMARLATQQARVLSRPARRRLAYVAVHK